MSSPKFDHIAIIYNPISTGNAVSKAKALAASIKENHKTIDQKPTLTPTKRPRHAQVLAENIAKKYKHPLIISVSGDGGYNEVVNGVMAAKASKKSARPVVAVMAAGNANDHKRVMRDAPLIELITKGEPKPMDIIHIRAESENKRFERYAHSYIGFGISPHVAVELNRHTLNKFRELMIVVKTFWSFKPFSVTYEGRTRMLDSLIFANINEMAKVLKFRGEADVTDNRFEVVEFKHEGKSKLLYHLAIAALFGLKDQPHFERYQFQVYGAHSAQLDGEVDELPNDSLVTITSIPKAIDALY